MKLKYLINLIVPELSSVNPTTRTPSNWVNVTIGVPQGAMQGSVLFFSFFPIKGFFPEGVANIESTQTHTHHAYKSQLGENKGRGGHLTFAVTLYQRPLNLSLQQKLLKIPVKPKRTICLGSTKMFVKWGPLSFILHILLHFFLSCTHLSA